MTESTTDADLQVSQALDAQPVEQIAEAVPTADSEPKQPEQEDNASPEPDTSANSDDDDLGDYWTKKGIDITTPEGQAKAAKSYREAEKAMHSRAQEASQLKRTLVDQPVTVDTTDPLVQSLAEEVVTMKRQQAINSFVNDVKLNGEQEAKLAEFITSTPNMTDLINGGYLTLKQAYQLSGVGSVDPSTYKSQGKQEALQALANKQTATAPKGNATTMARTPQGDPIMDVLLADD